MPNYATRELTPSIVTSMTPTPLLPKPLTKKDLVFHQDGSSVLASHRPTGCWVKDDNPERALNRLARMVALRLEGQQ